MKVDVARQVLARRMEPTPVLSVPVCLSAPVAVPCLCPAPRPFGSLPVYMDVPSLPSPLDIPAGSGSTVGSSSAGGVFYAVSAVLSAAAAASSSSFSSTASSSSFVPPPFSSPLVAGPAGVKSPACPAAFGQRGGPMVPCLRILRDP